MIHTTRTPSGVILVALAVVFFPECQPLDQEDARCDYLKHDGDGEEDDQEGSEWSTEFQSMTKLIRICREESNIHETLCIALVISHLLKVFLIRILLPSLTFIEGCS